MEAWTPSNSLFRELYSRSLVEPLCYTKFAPGFDGKTGRSGSSQPTQPPHFEHCKQLGAGGIGHSLSPRLPQPKLWQIQNGQLWLGLLQPQGSGHRRLVTPAIFLIGLIVISHCPRWDFRILCVRQDQWGTGSHKAKSTEEWAWNCCWQGSHEWGKKAPCSGGNGKGGKHTLLSGLWKDVCHCDQDCGEAHIQAQAADHSKGEHKGGTGDSRTANKQADGSKSETATLNSFPSEDICAHGCEKTQDVSHVQQHRAFVDIGWQLPSRVAQAKESTATGNKAGCQSNFMSSHRWGQCICRSRLISAGVCFGSLGGLQLVFCNGWKGTQRLPPVGKRHTKSKQRR